MAKIEGLPIDWKRLWQLVSGIHYETSNAIVKDKLLEVSKELTDGLLQFKKHSTSTTDLLKFVKKKGQEKLFSFTNKLQLLLEIDSEQCWDILCLYLVNEYRGSVQSLADFISKESNVNKLLDDIWSFYVLQRIIILKVLKNILEYFQDDKHPYHSEYDCFLKTVGIKKLKISYIDQLEYLINANPCQKLSEEFFNYQTKFIAWSESNAKETIEIIHILLLIIHYDGIEPNEFKRIFQCFKSHSFGKQQQYLDISNDFHSELIIKTTYSEVALCLLCFDFNEIQVDLKWLEELTEALNNDITSLNLTPEHGPIFLAWMLLNFRAINILNDEDSANILRRFGTRALRLNVFKFLYQLLTHHMFKDYSLFSNLARKAIYNHLSHLCDLFDEDGTVSQHSHIYELLCELLSWGPIAHKFCEGDETGVRSLYNTALENFPVDFTSLSLIAFSISSSGAKGSAYIKQQLENLPIYTEFCVSSKAKLQPISNDEYILSETYTPFTGIDFAILEKTNVIVLDKPIGSLAHFTVNLNYFNVLHNEINLLLLETTQLTVLDEDRINRVNSGIKYLSTAIKQIRTPEEISSEMVHPTEMVIDILHKLKSVQCTSIQLLANCLNVCAALLKLFDNEIITRILNLNILPTISNDTLSYKKYLNGASFDSSLVGYYLINYEKNLGKYDFLFAYINLLIEYRKLKKKNKFTLEIPGLVFLLREVFPYIHSWKFELPIERNKMYTLIVQLFFDILQTNSDQMKICNSVRTLRDICVYSMLNLDNGGVLLRFVGMGNPMLQAIMENETNWITKSSSGFSLLIQLSMTVLMQILRLKSQLLASSILSPLESLIYTQPKQRDALKIIPIITSYMNNIFNRRIPILSCRLLRRIAVEFKMSLLACLDMEPDQIRLTFLQKLPDDLESEDLKIAILEFVEACIQKQPGVTEAFFQVDHECTTLLPNAKQIPNIGDSILMYMDEYLEAVLNDAKIIASPLLSRIMSLFHALWKNNMQNLVKDLMEKPNFWNSLCNPLFANVENNAKAYSQLFNILGVELFCCNENNKNFIETIEKLLHKKYFDKWILHIFNLPKETIADYVEDETPDWLCRLQSFKDFMIILLRKNTYGPDIPNDCLKTLCFQCFNSLTERIDYTNDFRPLVIISELLLIVISKFKHKFTDNKQEDNHILKQITKILNNIAAYYDDIHKRTIESIFAVTIRCISLLEEELLRDLITASHILHPIIDCICIELKNLEKNTYNQLDSQDNLNENSLILSLNLLKIITNVLNTGKLSIWENLFMSSRLFNRLLSTTNCIVQLSSYSKLSVELLNVLQVFAESNNSFELLQCDIGDYLWLKLLPPKELLVVPYITNKSKKDTWIIQKWWNIYMRSIEFITCLLRKHKHHFIGEVLMFIGIHEEFLMDSLLLSQQSLETNATALIKSTVYLISELVKYESIWRLEHSKSLFNIMKCIQTLMEHCISLLYRPKILRGLMHGLNSNKDTFIEQSETISFDEIVTAMNELVEIIILCSKCLLYFSPSLKDLLCEPEFPAMNWNPLIEIQFGAPKLDSGTFPHLSFGSVLSAVVVFCKSLSIQNFLFHEHALNSLPESQEVENVVIPHTSEMELTKKSSKKKTTVSFAGEKTHFLKSMSRECTLNDSISILQSNEFISNLDGQLCFIALEHVLTLLASQSLLALRNKNLSFREKQLIRREISTELGIYHDFVRKKVLKEYNGLWKRHKQGILMMFDNKKTIKDKSPRLDKQRKSGEHQNSMRVNVVRRLHLQNKQNIHETDSISKESFEMIHSLSPIPGTSKKRSDLNLSAIASTPIVGKSALDYEPQEKKSNDQDIVYFEPIEPSYSPLSYVKFVEEDYLHILSSLFLVLCQSD